MAAPSRPILSQARRCVTPTPAWFDGRIPSLREGTLLTMRAINHRLPIALMVSSERSSRPSNHEGVLAAVRNSLSLEFDLPFKGRNQISCG